MDVSQTLDILGSTYNFGSLLSLFVLLALADLVLKGWSMWRAARMEKKYWFIALLVLNTAGILPITFLLMTKKQYKALQPLAKKDDLVALQEELDTPKKAL